MDEEQSELDKIKNAYDRGDVNTVTKLIYHNTTTCLMQRKHAESMFFMTTFLEHVKQSSRESEPRT